MVIDHASGAQGTKSVANTTKTEDVKYGAVAKTEASSTSNHKQITRRRVFQPQLSKNEGDAFSECNSLLARGTKPSLWVYS
mgnify:CR=1 FL=1